MGWSLDYDIRRTAEDIASAEICGDALSASVADQLDAFYRRGEQAGQKAMAARAYSICITRAGQHEGRANQAMFSLAAELRIMFADEKSK